LPERVLISIVLYPPCFYFCAEQAQNRKIFEFAEGAEQASRIPGHRPHFSALKCESAVFLAGFFNALKCETLVL